MKAADFWSITSWKLTPLMISLRANGFKNGIPTLPVNNVVFHWSTVLAKATATTAEFEASVKSAFRSTFDITDPNSLFFKDLCDAGILSDKLNARLPTERCPWWTMWDSPDEALYISSLWDVVSLIGARVRLDHVWSVCEIFWTLKTRSALFQPLFHLPRKQRTNAKYFLFGFFVVTAKSSTLNKVYISDGFRCLRLNSPSAKRRWLRQIRSNEIRKSFCRFWTLYTDFISD